MRNFLGGDPFPGHDELVRQKEAGGLDHIHGTRITFSVASTFENKLQGLE